MNDEFRKLCLLLTAILLGVPYVSAQTPNILWTKTYGGTHPDHSYSVQQTSDGGYIIVGSTLSFGAGIYDVYLIKTDANGDTLWTKTYGGTNTDEGLWIQQTSDGGYVITGSYDSYSAVDYDVYVIKTDPNGDTLWTRTYGGNGWDDGYSVQQTSNGGYVISGCTGSVGEAYLVWLIKMKFLDEN